MAKLTLQQLKRKHACPEGIGLFKVLFGREVDVTPELCIKYAHTFSWYWAADNLLAPEAQEKHRRIRSPDWSLVSRVPSRSKHTINTAIAFGRLYCEQENQNG